jgi:hypothetical protein
MPGSRESSRIGRLDPSGFDPYRLTPTSALSQLNFGVGEFRGFEQAGGNKEVPMQNRYIVRLTDEERDELRRVVKKLKWTGEKVRRAQILLKADADGPNWSDR